MAVIDRLVLQNLYALLSAIANLDAMIHLLGVRKFIGSIVDSSVYRWIDRLFLTLGSTLGILSFELYVRFNPQFLVDVRVEIYMAFAIGFAIDLVLCTVGNGTQYWYEIDYDPFNQNRKRLFWKTDPLINLLSLLTVTSGLKGLLDQARIVRVVRMVRVLRLTRIKGVKRSLEDISVTKIDEERARMIFIFVIGVSLMEIIPIYGPIIGTSVIMISILTTARNTRGIINSVFTKRFEEADDAVTELLMSSAQLRFLTDFFTNSRDEVAKLEDRFRELLDLIRDLVNPFGDDLELGPNNEIVAKDIDVAVLFSDIRNFTPLTEKYGKQIAPILAEYFSRVLAVIKEHGGKLGNTTGDGMASYFKDQYSEGQLVKSKEEAAIACAQAIKPIADRTNQILQERFPLEGNENDHSTGLGMKSGEVTIGDFLSRKKINDGEKREIHKPDLIGATVNRAARIESISKEYPKALVLISDSEFQRLPEKSKLRNQFQKCDFHFLKGVGEVQIWGLMES